VFDRRNANAATEKGMLFTVYKGEAMEGEGGRSYPNHCVRKKKERNQIIGLKQTTKEERGPTNGNRLGGWVAEKKGGGGIDLTSFEQTRKKGKRSNDHLPRGGTIIMEPGRGKKRKKSKGNEWLEIQASPFGCKKKKNGKGKFFQKKGREKKKSNPCRPTL